MHGRRKWQPTPVFLPGESQGRGSLVSPEVLGTLALPGRHMTLVILLSCSRTAYCAQSCLTLRDPMDCRPPGPSVHGILQARILEWVAMPSSRGRGSGAGTLGVPLGGTRRVGGLLGVAGRLSGTVSPFRAEQGQAPPSLGFSRQEHGSGLPFPSPMHESEK